MSTIEWLTDAHGRYALRGARVHRSACGPEAAAFDAEGFAALDLVVADARIEALHAAGADLGDLPDAELAGRVVLPGTVDCHTHLDKGHVWPRTPNPDGTFDGALDAVGRDREAHWSACDVETRMRFALECAYAHGTVAVRTHLDSPPPQDAISWPVFEAVREEWAGRIELQAACLFGIDACRDVDWFDGLVRRVAAAGGVLGTVTYPLPDLDALLDRVFAAALRHDLELDFHADETQDPGSATLAAIAAAAYRHRFERPILVGHCCSLARQGGDAVRRTLDAVAATTIGIVSLPLCNLYLQDRRTDGTTPRQRGVTLVHELAARGVSVSLASDNTRDPFYAYGDLDLLEVLRTGVRAAHLDHPLGRVAGVHRRRARTRDVHRRSRGDHRPRPRGGSGDLSRPFLVRGAVASRERAHGAARRSRHRHDAPGLLPARRPVQAGVSRSGASDGPDESTTNPP